MTGFEKLYNENRDFIFKYLMKMTRDITQTEELTQETFFRAYMNYASLKNKEKASVWLCQIAKNTYFAWYNEQKKKDSLDDLEVASSDVSIEDAFVQKELSQKALHCLHELEEPYKEVFMLSVFGGFSLKDISSIFVKSESWARVTFYRAKQNCFFDFIALIFGNIGQNTVVQTVESPSGKYYAQVIDSDQGALGGDTLVDVYEKSKINAILFKIEKELYITLVTRKHRQIATPVQISLVMMLNIFMI